MALRATALAFLIVLSSCDQAATRVSTMWTDVAEMASYVERFNASQRDWQVLVEYKEDLPSLLVTPGRKADLVVSRGLASTAVKDTLVPLDFLFDGGNLAKASFFRRVLDAGQQTDRQKLLPVSFDLPVLLYSRKFQPELSGFSLDVDTLKTMNTAFNAAIETKAAGRRLAFSPRWEGFSVTLLQWRGAAFQEGFQGALTWDKAKLADGLSFFQGWPAPGWDQVTEFQRKYLQADPGPLLVSGRVQFYPSTLASFLSRPWEERRDLDFRYLDAGGRVLAADSVVWAGIPSSSLTRGAAERFLSWFFQSATQAKLLAAARVEDDRSFGLAQGLPALLRPATTDLVQVRPELTARLPGADQVTFWNALPANWSTLKSAVVRPWLETPAAASEGLKAALDRYRLQAGRTN